MPSSTGTLVFNDQKIQAPDIYATESLGVGVSDPTSNLEVVGNAHVSSNLEVGTANLFVDTVSGNVGVGTASPQEKFHLYGSPMIQHDTRYSVGASVGWYKLGTWDAPDSTGSRLKISLLGAEGYNNQTPGRGGETIIYASINNNLTTSASNMSGSIHAYGDPVITQAKFKQVGTDRSQYEIHAYVESYTQHSMKIECTNTSTFTRAWTGSSDPGADSSTVQAALFTHVVNNDGNVGIGTTSPGNKLHIYGTDNQLFQIQNTNETARMVLNGASGTGGDLIFRQNGTSTWGIASIGDKLHFLGDDSTSQYRMTLDNSGNVGIGTTNPTSLLHIVNPSTTSRDVTVKILGGPNQATNDASRATLELHDDYNNAQGWGGYIQGFHESGVNHGMGLGSFTNGSKDGYSMFIRGGGNVGIGTTSPSYKLDVNGSMRVGSSTDYMYFLSSGTMAHGTRMNSSLETRFIYLGMRNTTGTAYYMVNAGSSSSGVSWSGYPGVWASGNGEYRIHGSGGTNCAVRADGGHLTFTGSHDTFTPFSEEDVGKIVCSTGEYSTELKNGVMYNELTVMDSCPIVTLATKDNDKRVMGVLSRRTTRVETERISEEEYDALPNKTNYEKLPSESNVYTRDVDTGEFSRGCYNAVGEGGIWVTNKNGVFENGDYIVSSTIPGYGQKQNDDLLHNFTVAKITSDCDFTDIQVIKQRHTSVDGIYQYNENGEPIRENVLDENGNTITFSKFKLRYLLPDGTQITKEEYALAAEAYIAAFVGCTYHCG